MLALCLYCVCIVVTAPATHSTTHRPMVGGNHNGGLATCAMPGHRNRKAKWYQDILGNRGSSCMQRWHPNVSEITDVSTHDAGRSGRTPWWIQSSPLAPGTSEITGVNVAAPSSSSEARYDGPQCFVNCISKGYGREQQEPRGSTPARGSVSISTSGQRQQD